jgi:hypothetical protein
MKRLLAVSVLVLSAFTLPDNLSPHAFASGARCIGANPCRACTTCGYCKRCNEGGGTCGVCRPSKKRPE